MTRILIITYEQEWIRSLEQRFARNGSYIIVGSATSTKEAAILMEATRPDLVLLDTHLQDGNAFDLLGGLSFIPFHLIFFSDTNEYAIRAFRAGALDYLLKPVNEAELSQALDKIHTGKEYKAAQASDITAFHEEDFYHNRIVLRTQNYMAVAGFHEIIYCEANGGYTTFHLIGGRKEMVTRSIKVYEEMLPATWFIRTHQSYLVNHHLIAKYHRDGYVVMRSGAEVPVATRKKEQIIKLISGKG